jgi:hypothetical protein
VAGIIDLGLKRINPAQISTDVNDWILGYPIVFVRLGHCNYRPGKFFLFKPRNTLKQL